MNQNSTQLTDESPRNAEPASFMKTVPSPHSMQKSGAFQWLWQDVIAQVFREGQVRGAKPSTLTTTASCCVNFLNDNGREMKTAVDRPFIDQLDNALANGGLAHNSKIVVTSTATDRSFLESRVRSLIRAHRALNTASFSVVLRSCLMHRGLKYSTVASLLGVPVTKIKSWLANNSEFVMDMTADQAVALDRILRAGGTLIATYAAMTQDMAYAPCRTAMDQVLQRESFGWRLRVLRRGAGLSVKDLLAAAAALSGIAVSKPAYRSWEQGTGLPSLERRGVVAVLDDIYELDGKLIKAWEAENPRKTYSPYLECFSKWPEKAQFQWTNFFAYKTTNPKNLRRSPARSGDRWNSDGTKGKVRKWFEHFFGFLVNVRGLAKDNLSLTLLADWELVKAYFDFVKTRTGAANYTQDHFTHTSFLHHLYTFFLDSLWQDAERETHWSGRLPQVLTVSTEYVAGVHRTKSIPLPHFKQQWKYHLVKMADAASEFQRANKFSHGSLKGKAGPLLLAEVGVAQIASMVQAQMDKRPVRICCRKMAILSRRWALVALSTARNMRPETFQQLEVGEIDILANLEITLDVPAKKIKTKGKGGSEGGLSGKLPTWPWIQEAIRYYLTQGRPFLLRKVLAGGGKDDGYLFTPAPRRSSKRAGGPMTEKSLQNDAKVILGYTPYAQRYIFANSACTNGVPLEDTAANLQHSPRITKEVYAQLTAEQRSRRFSTQLKAFLSR